MCHSDCYRIDEGWRKTAIYPLVPGHEIVAEVEKVGSEVTKFKPGDQVALGVFRDCGVSC